MNQEKPILEMIDIHKSFPGVKALNGVTLRAFKGEVMGLLGENGAGKSTLMKILSGVYQKDSGKILIEGKEVEIHNVREAQKLGISIIHQELSLLPNLTVYENLFLGNELVSKLVKKLKKQEMIKQSKELLMQIGFDINPARYVKELSVGEMQLLEIIKAVSKNSKIIIMDEPTAALTEEEVRRLFEIINQLKRQGVAIIYISHRIEEIFEICDRVTVLRDGMLVGEEKVENLTKEKLISMMVGRTLTEQFPYEKVEKGKTLLKVVNLSYGNKLKNISFELKKGEILGIAGLMGAGRTELGKVIFGEYKKTAGEIYLEGKKIKINSPAQAIRYGIVYLPEDRKREGLVLKLPVIYNMTLSNLRKYESGVFRKLNKKDEMNDYKNFVKRLSIKVSNPYQLVKNLSGGNQQKVIIAKWLLVSPKVLIIDEPTRGIDVGAKREIYEILNQLKKDGCGIIMISSEMPEILGISDRILVMHEGTITGEVEREKATQELIMKYAVGIT